MSAAVSPRYESLDAWRGIACLCVIVFHSTFYISTAENEAKLAQDATLGRVLSAGAARLWIGVPVFFVISGYCISATADNLRRNGRSTRDYFRRRFRRIFPAYWVALIMTIVAVAASEYAIPPLFIDSNHGFVSPWSLPFSAWPGNLLLTEGWSRHLFPTSGAFFLGHAWTLCYEEQFYLVVGIALVLSRRWFFFLMLIITVSVCLYVHLWRSPACFGFFFDGRWLLFAAGIAAYWDIVHASERQQLLLRAALVLGIIGSLVDSAELVTFHGNETQERFVAFSFALLLIHLRRHDQYLSSLPALTPLSACGSMCYSLYLVHYPITKAVSHGAMMYGLTQIWQTFLITVPACIALSLIAGSVFYNCIERRFLNTGHRTPRVTGREAAVRLA